MKQRRLGADGPMVGAIGLGAMSFAGFFGETDEDTSFACMEAALKAGVDFWDTSNIYGMGRSERVIGRFLDEVGGKVVLATKVGIVPGPPRRFDNTEDHIRSELEGSLTRLKRDHVELYYIHRRDQSQPVETTAEIMGRLIDEGVIGGWGLSEVAPYTLRRAHAVRPVMAVQNEYSLWTRLPELGMLRTCAELGVTFVPFSPLARGMLSDHPPRPEDMAATDFRKINPRFVAPNHAENERQITAFREFCNSRTWTTAAAAIAWVLQQGDHLIPIPGTRTAKHLGEWAEADQISFSTEDRDQIERILPAGFAWGDRYPDDAAATVERYC